MQVLKEIKYNRVGYLVVSFFALLLCFLFVWVGYFFESDDFLVDQQRPLGLVIGCTLGAIFCSVLFTLWMRSFFINPIILSIYEEGFEANTNGVSTGFVNWDDVSSVKEITRRVTGGTGTRKESAIAIYLKNADEYLKKQSAPIGLLMKLAKRTGKYKFRDTDNNEFGDDLPIFIERAALGREADEIIRLMLKLSRSITK